jgi:hypothetical protein
MKFLRSSFLGVAVGIAALLHAAPEPPLQDGEMLTYRVNWAIVPGAGEIKIEAKNELTGMERHLRVTTTTSTRRIARMLLPFDARADSIFDLRDGRLISIHETSTQRNRRNEHEVVFDYRRRVALYTTPATAATPRELPMAAGEPSDLIMALLETRTWNLQPGQSRDALVLFDDDFYELTIHAIRYEDVRTSLGTFKTIVLEPRMEKTPPKGMFKKGSTVRVWIAQDQHRLPVRFAVEFKIGTGIATLDYYEPPVSTPSMGTLSATPAAPAPNAGHEKDSRP